MARLDGIGTVASRFTITPFVGFLGRPPGARRPSPARSCASLEVPLSELLDPDVVPRGALGHRAADFDVHFYELDDETVWGATARILTELPHPSRRRPLIARRPPPAVDGRGRPENYAVWNVMSAVRGRPPRSSSTSPAEIVTPVMLPSFMTIVPDPGICCSCPAGSVSVNTTAPDASVICTQHACVVRNVSRNGLRSETVAPPVVRMTTGVTLFGAVVAGLDVVVARATVVDGAAPPARRDAAPPLVSWPVMPNPTTIATSTTTPAPRRAA